MATWKVQQLTGASKGRPGWPATGGVQTRSDPAVVQYKNQMHVCYLGLSDGNIWDVGYHGQNWQRQLLTVGLGNESLTSGPPAAGKPVVVVDNKNNSPQMHVCYTDAGYNIQDCWYGP